MHDPITSAGLAASARMSGTDSSTRRRALLRLGACGAWGLAGASRAAVPGWLGGDVVRGSGAVRASTHAPGQFTGIALGVPGVLELRIGLPESVSLEVDDNLLPLIEITASRGVLQLRPVRRELRLEPTQLRIVVAARQIDRLSVGGSGKVHAPSLSGPGLKVEVGGSGAVSVRQLNADTVSLAVGGAGRIEAAGTARSLSAAIGGAGEIRVGSLRAAQVSVDIAGAGDARVWATERLSIALAGAGEVGYYGDAQVSQAVAGVGRVRRLGSAPPG